jgi:hypothetical protein
MDFDIYCKRRPSILKTTIGDLFVQGHEDRFCYTLEDRIREIPGRPVEQWKIKGETAIPAGRYLVTLENSPRFGPDTITINAVAGFTGVRVHAGNDDADTEGCPLLGFGYTPDPNGDGGNITQSRDAVAALKIVIQEQIAIGNTVYWNTINPSQSTV